MALMWSDSTELALALMEAHPGVDPRTVRYTQLSRWILALDDFADNPNHCGERVLEGVQMAWIDEFD